MRVSASFYISFLLLLTSCFQQPTLVITSLHLDFTTTEDSWPATVPDGFSSGTPTTLAKVRTLNTHLFTGTTSGTLTFEEWTSEAPITIE